MCNKVLLLYLSCIIILTSSCGNIHNGSISNKEQSSILNFVLSEYNIHDSSLYNQKENRMIKNYLKECIYKKNEYYNSIIGELLLKNYHIPSKELNFTLINGNSYHYFSLGYLKRLRKKLLENYRLQNGKYYQVDSINSILKFSNENLTKIINSERDKLNISLKGQRQQEGFDKIIELIWLTHTQMDDDLNFFTPLLKKEDPEYIDFGKSTISRLRNKSDENSRLAYFSINNLGYLIFEIKILNKESIEIHQYLLPYKIIFPEIQMD